MSDFDKKLAEDLAEDFDDVLEQLRKAMSSTVRVAITEPCPNPKCNCKHFRYAEVPDWKTKMSILDWWSNRSHGRPGQKESEEDSEKISFHRHVVMPVEDES